MARWRKQPPNIIIDRYGTPVPLGNLYHGCTLFITLPGPSLNDLDLTKLNSRGIVTMGVNNSPATWRPHLWTHVDRPLKFHNAIWSDPAILKFVPHTMLRQRIRTKTPDGKFKLLQCRANSLPGVFGYRRSPVFNPETYLTEDYVCWGNNKKNAEANGHPHIMNVMFVVLRLAYYLGFFKVYLLGCDFKMSSDRPTYSFNELKDESAMSSNNGSYCKLNHMLGLLRGKFDAANFRVFNCNENSNLLAFDTRRYDDAITEATRGTPEALDCSGWYADPRKSTILDTAPRPRPGTANQGGRRRGDAGDEGSPIEEHVRESPHAGCPELSGRSAEDEEMDGGDLGNK